MFEHLTFSFSVGLSVKLTIYEKKLNRIYSKLFSLYLTPPFKADGQQTIHGHRLVSVLLSPKLIE